MAYNAQSTGCGDLCSPIRNRYYYGKLLDVFHLDLEQHYFNNKRWLLNRLISGYGVVCGLDVQLTPDGQSVVVRPGVAIDRCGREIIVCQPSEPVTLPQPQPAPTPSDSSASQPSGSAQAPSPPASSPSTECCEGGTYKHLSICYHECQTEPSPALGGDCDTQAPCTPGAIRERYCLKLIDGKLCPAPTTLRLQDVISGGVINYGALTTYVAGMPCASPSDDCCIPLANIQIPTAPQTYSQGNISISVRPIVYTNDLLYNLIVAWMNQGQSPAYSKP